jgi:formylglycine-generating enzyme required for sulfatase activity
MKDTRELSWLKTHEWVQLTENQVTIGSGREAIESAADYWISRLIKPEYTRQQLESWLFKEHPQHQVHIKAFKMLRFPVTNLQFKHFLDLSQTPGSSPESLEIAEPADHPVWGLSYESCQKYCQALNEVAQRYGSSGKVSVPTEFQWEYAAKGASTREYPYGHEFNSRYANTIESGIGKTTPVTKYLDYASPFGICDLAGNVEEWTSSDYSPYPGGIAVDDDLTKALGRYKVLRGGSFRLGGDLTRCARRHGPHPDPIFRYVGFRLAMSLESPGYSAEE